MPDASAAKPGRLARLGSYYRSPAQRGIGWVRRVPTAWPRPLRLALQVLIAAVVVVLVLVAWSWKTLAPVLGALLGQQSEGASPSGPPKYSNGNG